MSQVKKLKSIPQRSIIQDGFDKIDYWDSFQVTIETDENVDQIATKIFKAPRWVDILMSIRDSIVKPMGLRTSSKNETHVADYYPVGSKAGIFKVIDRNDDEIVMAENDKHLDFRTSVLISHESQSTRVSLTTIVRYNNMLGKFYFIPVKPFHQMIIRSILKRI